MNIEEALVHANALVIPEMLLFGGEDAVLGEIRKNEDAIHTLLDAWNQEEVPSFMFEVVLGLADRNRNLCDNVDPEVLGGISDPNLPRSLNGKDIARGIAALQGRKESDVAAELDDASMTRGAVYAAAPVSGTVFGIDLETTSRYPDRGYIVNAGWGFIDLEKGAQPYGADAVYCGIPDVYAEKGVPLENIHHISYDQIADKKPFREDKELQVKLLDMMMEHPYMAHNAAFEDTWFTLHLDGYAEARKAGYITVIDTRDICRSIDPEVARASFDTHPASLENWARRRGVLSADDKEQHLGMDDTDLMLKTVVAEFGERNLLK